MRSSPITTEAGGVLRMLMYDGLTMDEVQTASNEDPIEMQVEDADVDVDLFQEKRNKKDGKVLS
jgi:hypothetical protein